MILAKELAALIDGVCLSRSWHLRLVDCTFLEISVPKLTRKYSAKITTFQGRTSSITAGYGNIKTSNQMSNTWAHAGYMV